MFNVDKLLSNLKNELLVVVVIIVADLYQIPKIFEHRKNFGTLEFWNLFCFVQVIVFALVLRVLQAYALHILSSATYITMKLLDEQMQQLHSQTKEMLQQLKEKRQ